MLKTGQFQGSVCAEALQCGPGTGLRLGLKLKGQTTWNESKCPTILYLWCPYMPFTCVYFHVFPNSIFPWTTHRPKAFCHFCLFSWLQVMLLLLYLYSVLGVSLFAKVIWAQLDFQQLDTLSKPSRRYLSGFASDLSDVGRSHTLALVSMASCLQWSTFLTCATCIKIHQHPDFFDVLICFLCIFVYCSVHLYCFAVIRASQPSLPRPASELQNLFPGKNIIHSYSKYCQANIGCVKNPENGRFPPNGSKWQFSIGEMMWKKPSSTSSTSAGFSKNQQAFSMLIRSMTGEGSDCRMYLDSEAVQIWKDLDRFGEWPGWNFIMHDLSLSKWYYESRCPISYEMRWAKLEQNWRCRVISGL